MNVSSETAVQRCSSKEVFFKRGVLKCFAIFTGKVPVLESLFHKIAGLKICNFIKKRLQHRRLQHKCFLVNIAKLLRTAFIEHLLVAASGFIIEI